MCAITRVLCMCFKNLSPRPSPKEAPLINPGKSAATKVLPSIVFTTPKLGFKVVKWYAAILGFDAEILDKIVDLPTDGIPTKPTSASNLSSTFKVFSSPGSPCSEKLGAGFVAVAKAVLPRPPLPPLATITLSPFLVKSAIIRPVSISLTVVPKGTFIITSDAPLPFLFLPSPFAPLGALISFWYLKSRSVLRPKSVSKIMFAPRPPLPPKGPPSGMYFSLLKAVHPSPPLPALTFIITSSTNIKHASLH